MTTKQTEARWTAVLERDPSADGAFVYAVRSTGIFCRPTCASRRPARRQVEFFDTSAAAHEAGFRACRRCRPDDPAAADRGAELVARLLRSIEANQNGRLTLDTLAAGTGRSVRQIQRLFKRVTGVTPREYAAAQRVGRLKAGLKTGGPVTRAQYDAGYTSSSRLYERAGQALGMTPATYQRGGAGAKIGYTVTPTSLGPLLVAGTQRGLCAVRFGESAADLERSLREEYPEAQLLTGEPRASLWAAVLRAQVDGLRPSSLLPLDVQATAFQSRVWQALRRIPWGETRTYRDIAASLDRPAATRAVARACATNPAALAIPCHRIVRTDGELGGYKWGLERKEALLAREKQSTDNR